MIRPFNFKDDVAFEFETDLIQKLRFAKSIELAMVSANPLMTLAKCL
jgi:hypothetical protein